jgi:tetratricopeptide (TPR) repeat protein
MPFGLKKDPSGGPDIDFDRIYEDAIRPGIEGAGMEPIRADEERTGGIIHQAMFERLLLCDFAVADLTTANANVFYELGVRHAARPSTTLAIFASSQKPPFDVNYLRALPYELSEGNRFGSEQAARLRSALAKRLEQLRDVARTDGVADSPVFQLLKDYKAPELDRLKTDVFRESIRLSVDLKQQLATARSRRNEEQLASIEESLGQLDGVEAGVLVDLFLSYRALSAWEQMIRLYSRLPKVLQRSVMLREQLALALNRNKERQEAIRILEEIVSEQGPSSETNGILGRVYKDLWVEATKGGQESLALGYLDRAIASYVRGFEADWRDAYPGINAVTLLDIKGDDRSLKRKSELLPVVRFAVSQRMKSARPDYWDHATMLELGVLDGDQEASRTLLSDALVAVREPWEPATTGNNLNLIRDARRKRGVEEPWVDEIIGQLLERGKS